ncbi:unnamed protein product, partial [Sphagnum jensenii]
MFLTNRSVTYPARVLSPMKVSCLGTDMAAFHIGPISTIEITFNDQDYISVPVNYSFPKPQQDFFSTDMEISDLSFSAAINEFTEETVVISTTCDNSFPVEFNMSANDYYLLTSSLEGLQSLDCAMDESSSPAYFLNFNTAVCLFPAKPPGGYKLSLKRMNQSLLSYAIKCYLAPKIYYVTLLPPMNNVVAANTFKFGSLNLSPSLHYGCLLNNNKFVVATTPSPKSLICQYDSLEAGYITLSLWAGTDMKVVHEISFCLLPSTMVSGGDISSSIGDRYSCFEAIETNVQRSIVAYEEKPIDDIKQLALPSLMYYPKSGSTYGGTVVKFYLVENEDIFSDISFTCSFESSNVSALLVKKSTVLCISPPSAPGNFSLELKSSNGLQWTRAWFYYVLPIKVLNIQPDVAPCGTPFTLQISTAVHEHEPELLCIVGTQSYQAEYVSPSLISCNLPAMIQGNYSVLLSGENNIGSNIQYLNVIDFSYHTKFSPTHGSLWGDTEVRVLLPLVFVNRLPVCVFGSVFASTRLSSDNLSLVCTTPALPQRIVLFEDYRVNVYLSINSNLSYQYYIGSYMYEYPAEIDSLSPSVATVDSITRIYVSGNNFLNNVDLSCVLTCNDIVLHVRARWQSNSGLWCDVNMSFGYTQSLKNISISVSNNAYDTSAALQLETQLSVIITDFSPKRGYTGGGTSVKFLLLNEIKSKLYCLFYGADELVEGDLITSKSFACKSPMQLVQALTQSGSITVMDELKNVLGITAFDYAPLPSIIKSSSQTVMGGVISNLELVGVNLEYTEIGRLRSMNGGDIGSCLYLSFTASLNCTLRPLETDTLAMLDLSTNGVDYIHNIAAITVISPTAISNVVLPDFLYSCGGQILRVYVAEGAKKSLTCTFSEGYPQRENKSSIALLEDGSYYCLFPTLRPGIIQLFLTIEDFLVYPVLDVQILGTPLIESVYPSAIVAGIASTVNVYLAGNIPVNSSLVCVVASNSSSGDVGITETQSDFIILTSLKGYCDVSVKLDGVYSLQLQPVGVLKMEHVSSAQYLTVEELVMDFYVNGVSLYDEIYTVVEVLSASCSIPSNTLCNFGDNFTTIFVSRSNRCGISCALDTTALEVSTIFTDIRLCLIANCNSPLFAASIPVLRSIFLIESVPNHSSSIGNTPITLVGNYFAAGTALQCLFGDTIVQSELVSPNEIRCVSPSMPPGRMLLSVLQNGVPVSNSILFNFYPFITSISIDPLAIVAEGGGTLTCSFNGTYDLIPGNYSLHLQLVGTTVFSHIISVKASVFVVSASPLRGFAGSSTLVTLNINPLTELDISLPVGCCVGDFILPPVEVTATRVVCRLTQDAVPSGSEAILLGLQLDPTEFCQAAKFNFTSFNFPHVVSISPRRGSIAGGTLVSLVLFKAIPPPLFCRIGLAISQAFISSDCLSVASSIRCLQTITCITAASLVPGEVELELSVNRINFIATGQKFIYEPIYPRLAPLFISHDPRLLSVTPSVLMAGVEQIVLLTGNYFEQDAACLLSNNKVPSLWRDDEHIECYLPLHILGSDFISVINKRSNESNALQLLFEPTPVLFGAPPVEFPDTVSVQLVTELGTYVAMSLQFQYVADPEVYYLHPLRGRAGTNVSISGHGFLTYPVLQCAFDGMQGSTKLISDTELLCVVPEQAVVGDTWLTFLTNGQYQITTGLIFEYTEWSAQQLIPNSGPATRGGTLVTVLGAGFVNVVNILCHFGSIEISAVFVSPEEIQCLSPSMSLGSVVVTVTVDGANVPSIRGVPLLFYYYADLSIAAVTPAKGLFPG